MLRRSDEPDCGSYPTKGKHDEVSRAVQFLAKNLERKNLDGGGPRRGDGKAAVLQLDRSARESNKDNFTMADWQAESAVPPGARYWRLVLCWSLWLPHSFERRVLA